MPRVADIYQRPPGIDAVPNQTIESVDYNTNVADVEFDLNFPRPIVAGGTGANSAVQARDNLDAEVAMQTVTNYDTHPWETGSFKSDPGAINSPDGAGSAINKYAGTVQVFDATHAVVEARNLLSGIMYMRKKTGGVWSGWTEDSGAGAFVLKAGDTMTGQLRVNSTGGIAINSPIGGNALLNLNKPNSGSHSILQGSMAGKARWLLSLGNTVEETGANAGSDFGLYCHNDAGNTIIHNPLTISRSTGATTLSGPLNVNSGNVTAAGSFLAGGNIFAATTGAAVFATSAPFQMHFRPNGFSSTVGEAVLNPSGVLFTNGGLNVTGSAVFAGGTLAHSGGYSYLGWYNAGAAQPRTGTDLAIGWNYSGGGRDMGFINTDVAASWGFTFSLMRSAASSLRLMNMYTTGVEIPLTTESTVINNGALVVAGGIGMNGNLNMGQFIATRGIMSRAGSDGAYNGYNYNLNWTGAALQCWIGAVNAGSLQFVSDYRTKKDVVDLSGTWDVVKALRPIKYTQTDFTPPSEIEQRAKDAAEGREVKAKGQLFTADDKERWGFVAHELQATMIEDAATGYKDAPDVVQSPNPWTIIAALTKALQEAMARIEVLEQKLEVSHG